MCGRYTQVQTGDAIAAAFNLAIHPNPIPRYNIAPSQPVSAIAHSSCEREYRIFQWGFVPAWAKDPAMVNRMINARSETVADKPSFRTAFKRRRCLIIADGFYEWKKAAAKGAKKQPYYIQMADQSLFGMAGIWEAWQSGDGSYLESCTILTTEPNTLMKPIHHRMPVIVNPQDYELWLDPAVQKGDAVQSLLRPFEAGAMQAYEVSTAVNNPRNETATCIEPLVS